MRARAFIKTQGTSSSCGSTTGSGKVSIRRKGLRVGIVGTAGDERAFGQVPTDEPDLHRYVSHYFFITAILAQPRDSIAVIRLTWLGTSGSRSDS